MKSSVLALAAALALGAVGTVATAQTMTVSQAVADPARKDTDRALDAQRHPAETLALLDLKPGQKVVDVFPGPYWDVMFADLVGPSGHVYEAIPAEVVKMKEAPSLPDGTAPHPEHPNITTLTAPIDSFPMPQGVDVVWIRQNYHDLYDKFMGPANVPAFNKAVYKALKPGGLYVIIDHAAPAGSDLKSTDTTHRIDEARVKKDLADAGFKLVRTSDVLRNPADDRTKLVFDPTVKGHTDQFVFIYQKP